jgi:hypothetical protein
MSWQRSWLLFLVSLICILGIGVERPRAAQGAVEIFASPVQAGCYLARHDRCKIHVEPFTLNLASGKKLVFFELLTTRIGSGIQRVIYDFRTDVSNPVPFSGSTYTPSLVTQDFAATCGSKYTISLQGQDSGDTNPLNLGVTGQIQCPTGTFIAALPLVMK